jgi:CBS domain-containing protein
MRVRDVMTHTVLTLQPDQSIQSAIAFFAEHKISGAPVVNGHEVIGIVSEKDIFRALYPSVSQFYDNQELWLEEGELETNAEEVSRWPIKKVMCSQVVTTPPDTLLMQAGAMMLARRIHRIVVMESGKLVGIITRSDVFHNVFRKFSK